MDGVIRETARAIHRSKRVVAFTGAGISVESGIPDFRSAGGLWERFDPLEYATIDAFRANPGKVWVMLKEMGSVLARSRPNPAHHALARLEEMGHLRSVITQNIDHLHQDAGSKRVIEFHGNHRTLLCLDCGRSREAAKVSLESLPPRCGCGGVLKPNVVLFGEMILWAAQAEALEEARSAEVMLVVGTSAIVFPACDLPVAAKRAGAIVVEVNLEETPLTGHISKWILKGPAGPVLQSILQEVEAMAGQ